MSAQIALIDGASDPTQRREHDFYPTPSWMTRALMRRIPVKGRVLECCAGHNAIANVLHECGCAVITNEPYQTEPPAHIWRLDATRRDSWAKWTRFDWIVSNPPFDVANEIVPLALEHARIGVAMVLRLSWFEPTKERAEFLKAHRPALINMPRHNFRGQGSGDSVTAAWFVWLANEGRQRYGSFDNDVVTPRERDELVAAERLALANRGAQ